MLSSVEPSAGGRLPPPSRSFSDILKGPSASFNPKPLGQFRGKPAVTFSEDDIKKYSEPFQFSLIGKFSNGRPPMDSLRKSFHSIGFSCSFSLGLIDSRHILIRFDHQEDYLRCWKRGYWSLEGFLMRVIKWHPNFSVETESPLVPVWINLLLLPIHLYNKEALFSIARLIGEPLKIDAATEALSRPSQARVCIELDLMKERCEEVYITLGSFSYWQKIEYENIPLYCSVCHKIGHNKETCRKNENRKNFIPTQSAANKNQEVPKGQVRQEYRPIQKDMLHPTDHLTVLVEPQTDAAQTDAPVPAIVSPPELPPAAEHATLPEPPDALLAAASVPTSVAAIAKEDKPHFSPSIELAHSSSKQNTHNPSEDLEKFALTNEVVPSEALVVPVLITATTVGRPLLENEGQNSSTEDVLELGEIANAAHPYASDSEVDHSKDQDFQQQSLTTLPNLIDNYTATDLPSSSNVIENRGWHKKKSQHQQDRMNTRQTNRGLTHSLP